MSDTRELPLFPLNTVLFPGMTLPLHIFEERYKQMIAHCVKESKPFGVVLIRDGEEVGTGADIYDIGTTAHITQVEQLPGGRLNIATLGYRRFKILDVQYDQPYLVGQVEDFPLEDQEHPGIRQTAARMAPLLQTYLEIFADLGKVELEVKEMPEDPVTLAFLTAIILRTPMKDKQDLLGYGDLLGLLRAEYRILHRESQILRLLVDQGARFRDDSAPFSIN